jgi:hypothetical protein
VSPQSLSDAELERVREILDRFAARASFIRERIDTTASCIALVTRPHGGKAI